MIALWRLSNSQDLQPRARPAGRWHGAGAPVVVLDANPAAAVFARLALSEVAHPRALPSHYFLLEVMAPDHAVSDADPPLHWETDRSTSHASSVTERWLTSDFRWEGIFQHNQRCLARSMPLSLSVALLKNHSNPEGSIAGITNSILICYCPNNFTQTIV